MKLRYTITTADVLRANLYGVTHNRALRWYLGVLLTVIIGLSVRDYLARGNSPGVIVLAVIIQLMLYAALITFGLMVVAILTLRFSRGRGVLGEHELELTENGLVERTDVNESLHKWAGIGAIDETARHFFIRVNEAGGSLHVVPKAHGILEGDSTAFVTHLRERKRTVGEP